jgi:hypothetical protein
MQRNNARIFEDVLGHDVVVYLATPEDEIDGICTVFRFWHDDIELRVAPYFEDRDKGITAFQNISREEVEDLVTQSLLMVEELEGEDEEGDQFFLMGE